MSAFSIQPTFPIFTESDGLPLENGYIWLGAANLDPQGNPINVYWDAALTIPAGQPIRTLNGYPSRNGTPARMYVNSDYSIRVQDSKGSLVYSAPVATERYNGAVISSIDATQVTFTATGAGATQVTLQDQLDWTFVRPENFGAVGDGVTDDTVAWQAAIDALQPGQILLGNKNYRLTDGLNVTSKTRNRITGKGRLFFDGAPSGAYMFLLIGTIDDLEIDSLMLIGDGNSGYSQGAIGNNSGQTITNVRFHDLHIMDINVGISHNANLGGTFRNAQTYANVLTNILGTVPGSGYGIQMAKAYNIQVFNNIINNASRHSIYQGSGQNVNVLIEGNMIINHRKDVADASPRMAISCSRSSDVTIANNKFLDCYDGQINVDQDTGTSESISNILIIGNTFTNRKNVVPAIWIGEQLVPTTARVFKVSVLNNTFDEDQSIPGGLGTTVYILHGNQINVEGNRFRRYNVTAALSICVEIGGAPYISSDADISDIIVRNNFATADNSVAGSRFAYIVDQLCTGNSMYLIKDNVRQGWASEFYFETSPPTNPNSKLKFFEDVTYNIGVLTPGANGTYAFTVNGCKPTSQVTSKMLYSIQTAPIPVYTFGAKDDGPNAVYMTAANTSLTVNADPPSQVFRFFVEDF
jgi:hypothetical protein